MTILSGKKGKHGFVLDGIYTDTQTDYDLVPALGLSVKTIAKNTVISVAYQYELVDDGASVIDVFGGLRYWKVDSTLKFSGGLGFLAGQSVSNEEDWIDPVIGVKVRHRFVDSRFYTAGWMSMGGFGVGSDFFCDAAINVGYKWTDAIGTSLGYRIYDVDYDDNGFLYSATYQGVVFGLTWQF